MNGRDEALRLLAGKEAAGPEFFRIAARALALGLGCRWAGFATLCADGQSVEVLAMSDGERLVAPFRYALADSPCRAVYACLPEEPYRFHARLKSAPVPLRGGTPDGALHGASHWAGPFSYRGEAIFDHDRVHRAHAFAIGDSLREDDADDRMFFRLVAQRAGAEMNRLEALDALRLARAAADRVSLAKTGYLVRLANVMRTPLNAVVGFSEVIRDMPDGDFEAGSSRDYASEILSIGAHLRRLVDDVHMMAKIESEELWLAEEAVELNCLTDECVALVRDTARQCGVSLKVTESAAPVTVLVDATLMKRLILKLLANAIQFNPAGGEAGIAVGIGAHGGPEIRVTDTGIGMEPHDVAAALMPFQRPSSREGGGGLGLPLAKALCGLHGGTLAIDSAPGEGTIVSVRLPASRRLCEPGMRAVA